MDRESVQVRPVNPELARLVLAAIDAAMECAEWETADHLLRAMEQLCARQAESPYLTSAYAALARRFDRR